ncbi:Ig-like domain-containing protein [Dyadobacter pollutisoli]|uniref:Ig-like domain-containing protein n=1 Tax=Dyadobacter pollutisoli TaxID=2910158 RepID=A0A9E8SKK7_9BACT|nr:Ig-like domain-containing protein [Dyadobacter pollutisoli]WAC12600.1 Ig-like domain-containing protein [Dyadobacter pollutisoli]
MVRSCVMYGLTFFVFFNTLFSCNPATDTIDITWKDKRAVAITFPLRMAEKVPADSIEQLIRIHLLTKTQPETPAVTAVLGDYSIENGIVTFTPLIPFTRGLHYVVWAKGARVGAFSIPAPDIADSPKLLAIYPSQDTLPENLLKIYMHFSQPMREGLSDKYVALVKNGRDTVAGAFLNLQPELWNEDRTKLTLWLDPGRTKRDLIPNQKLGAPLTKNGGYQIVVSRQWHDQQGASLFQTYTKDFVTIARDSLSPEPKNWKLGIPAINTSNPLQINFGEPLDYGLLNEAMKVKNDNAMIVSGKWQFNETETIARFIPTANWTAGKYSLQIDTRLEDLAGNNINRPFDRDITKKTAQKSGATMTLEFHVK